MQEGLRCFRYPGFHPMQERVRRELQSLRGRRQPTRTRSLFASELVIAQVLAFGRKEM
jgi:hypothetical protein